MNATKLAEQPDATPLGKTGSSKDKHRRTAAHAIAGGVLIFVSFFLMLASIKTNWHCAASLCVASLAGGAFCLFVAILRFFGPFDDMGAEDSDACRPR